MDYRLALMGTELTVGRCACLPPDDMDLDRAAEYLRVRPMDKFMHAHAVGLVMEPGPDLSLDLERAGAMAGRWADNPAMLSVLYEATLVRPELAPLRPELGDPVELARYSPDIALRSHLLPDQELHRAWVEILGAGVQGHGELPRLDEAGLAKLGLELPFGPEELSKARLDKATARGVRQSAGAGDLVRDESSYPAAPDVTRAALSALRGAGMSPGAEMRHQASLSPVAVLRRWPFSVSVSSGAVDYTLSGEQTSYGRGLWMDRASASCAMEAAERRSAWVDVAGERVSGLVSGGRLERGSRDDLVARGLYAVDLSRMALEVPYQGQELYWIKGAAPDGKGGERPAWVPAQCVFPFLNLDEPSLFSGLGSTGLGAGAFMPQARRAALLEVVERDAEAVTPFDWKRCFRLTSKKDPEAKRLLAEYAGAGVEVCFMDMTPEYGVPCYKAFVVGADGTLAKGAAAGLDGPGAAMSALLEVPHPWPDGPATRPLPDGIPFRKLESLPNLSTGHVAGDAALLESLLAANGLEPVYVDLTREELRIPVVRAIVPGLEIMADFDRYSRVSPRLLANCLGR